MSVTKLLIHKPNWVKETPGEKRLVPLKLGHGLFGTGMGAAVRPQFKTNSKELEMNPKMPEDEMKAIDRNIAAVHRLRTTADESRRLDQKVVDSVTNFVASTNSIYLHLMVYGTWMGLHFAGQQAGSLPFSTSLEDIGLAASLEAIFLAVFVLINQKRTNALDRKNSDLHLQMSLLAEHEITRIAQMTDLISKRLGVNTDQVQGLEAVKKDVDPNEILDRISEHERNTPTDSTSDSLGLSPSQAKAEASGEPRGDSKVEQGVK